MARPRRASRWRDLVREVEARRRKRVVISSEGFADANDEGDRTVVTDLGGRARARRRHAPPAGEHPALAVAAVRPGRHDPRLRGLAGATVQPATGKTTPSFWHRHRHDQLVERWARVVGAGPDHRRRRRRPGPGAPAAHLRGAARTARASLRPRSGRGNRSLTLAETEMLRNLNKEFRANELPAELYSQLVRNGA